MSVDSPKFKYVTVLLIDDNELDNFINQKMVETNFFSKNVYASTSGEIALDFVNKFVGSFETGEESFLDVMFVDLNMPQMNGFEFIENVKKINSEKLKKCKIVILTSSIDNEDRAKALRISSSISFINKPLTNEFLKSL